MRCVKAKMCESSEIQCAKMLGKPRNAVFFDVLCAWMAQKVTSLKRRVRSPLAQELAKNGTRPRREAHLEVKIVKNCQLGPLLEDPTSKIGTRPRREAHLEVKIVKNCQHRSTFGRSNFKNWHAA